MRMTKVKTLLRTLRCRRCRTAWWRYHRGWSFVVCETHDWDPVLESWL